MKIKEVILRLSRTFEYERFQKSFSQQPRNPDELKKTIIAFEVKERKMLEPIFDSLIWNNMPKGDRVLNIVSFARENETMKRVRASIDRWTKELMPDWHKVSNLLRNTEK